jgi:hypothetical protein
VTDDAGLTNSVSVVVTPETIRARAQVPTPHIVMSEAHPTTQEMLTADAVVLPAGVNRQTFLRMFDLARKLANSQ